MREEFVRELGLILERIRLEPSGEVHFNGPFPEASDSIALGMPTRLQHWLNQNCFCSRLPEGDQQSPRPPERSRSLVVGLSQANSCQDAWDFDWEIIEVAPNGRVRAKKRETDRDFWSGEFISMEGPGLPPRAGMHLKAFFPRESVTMQPGFYFAFGNTAEEEFDELSIVRFYWAVASTGARLLMKEVTGNLNRFQIPFRLKMPVDASLYNRLDAAVLYVNKRYYQAAAVLLARVHRIVQSHLAPLTPLFTKTLAAGLGLAEDPGNGESFGMQRCRVLAEAISNAHLNPIDSESHLEAVVSKLELAGIRAAFPYLRAGSVDQYEFVSENGNP